MLDFSIITQEILLGSQVTCAEDIEQLAKLRVAGLLSLQNDNDLRLIGLSWDVIRKLGISKGIDMRRVPIRDPDPPHLVANLEKGVEALDQLVRQRRRVYVHCSAGVNRSASVVLSWFVIKKGLSVEEGYRLLKSRRPCIQPSPEVLKFLSERQHVPLL